MALLVDVNLLRTVSEIKGAPCTRCAHFHGRVHDFRRCAPGVCTFFEPVIQLHIKRVQGKTPGHTVLEEVHPVGAPNKTLISDTVRSSIELSLLIILYHIKWY